VAKFYVMIQATVEVEADSQEEAVDKANDAFSKAFPGCDQYEVTPID